MERSGAVQWHVHESSDKDGALEQCCGDSTGAVPLRESRSSSMGGTLE